VNDCISSISYAYTQGMTTTHTTKKNPRKSTCNHCSQKITEKALINATDIEAHIEAFGEEDDTLVWLGTDKRAMCYATNFDTSHATDKEVRGN
jgi:hypothetical protein